MEEWIHVCRLDKFIGLTDKLMDGWIDASNLHIHVHV